MAACFLFGIAGCEKDDTAEKAGKKIDRSIDDAEKKIKKLFD